MKPQPIRILVVEDNADDLLIVRESLSAVSGREFDILHAGRLSEAVEMLGQKGIALVLLDLGLPDGSGLECVIRMRETAPNVPLIVLSGNQDEELAQRAVRIGAQDYLVKGEIAGRQLPRAIRYAIERKTAQDEIRLAKDKYEALLESIPDAVYSAPADPRLPRLFVSTRWQAWTGISLEDSCKDPEAWLAAIHPEDRERVRDAIEEASREGNECILEYRIVHKDTKRTRNVRDHAIPIMDPSGRLLQFDGIVADVTVMKQMESKLREAQKLEAIGRLASGVAHEFNNKLTVIIGSADYLLGELEQGGEHREIVAEIRTAGRRAAAIASQLLAFSRKQVLDTRILDLNEELGSLRSVLDRSSGDKIEIVISPAPALGSVSMDRGQLEQVLINLVINARDAMPEGGKVLIATENLHLNEGQQSRIQGVPAGDYVTIAVTDSGPGISPEVVDKIFEPFFTTKALGRGTGLGLAIVDGIVKQSDGYIQVWSIPGKGTTFKILLPRVGSTTSADLENTDSSPHLEGSESILLVEDEPAVRQLASRILRAQGYAVHEAADGKSALAIAEERKVPFDLVLTDMYMPEMTGRELADRLTAISPETRVMYMSGYFDDELVLKEIKSRRCQFLQKPFVADELLKGIREALDAPRKPSG